MKSKSKTKNYQKRFTYRVSNEMFDQYSDLASKKGVSQALLVRDALTQYLENQRSVAA